MADIEEQKQSESVRIVGSDESFAVDVVLEDGVKKMLVKASVTPTVASRIIFDKALNGLSSDLNVNGSVTPVEFEIVADPTDDKIIRELKFSWFDNGITIDSFLGENGPLVNGIDVEFVLNGVVQSFFPIKYTAQFNSNFSYGSGSRFELIVGSGADYCTATYSPREPIVLKAGTTDKIICRINDDLTKVSQGELTAFGLYDN